MTPTLTDVVVAKHRREDQLKAAGDAYSEACAQANDEFADAILERLKNPDTTFISLASELEMSRQTLHLIVKNKRNGNGDT